MIPLIINSSNAVATNGNNIYTYNFPGGGVVLKQGDQLGVQMIQVPYSWFNITSVYNNNSFAYMINGNTYTVNIQDGFYTMVDINNLLHNAFLANGHYLLDSYGNYWFPANFTTNASLYAIQFDAFVIPATLPTGYTNPANVFYNTLVFGFNTCIQLKILSNKFQQLIGFSAGLFPTAPHDSIQSFISTLTPNITPVNSVIIRCNLVDNRFSVPNDAFYSFSPNTTFGSNINVVPSVACWIDCKVGNFTQLQLQFVDQNFVPLPMNDTNLTITLLIKSKEE